MKIQNFLILMIGFTLTWGILSQSFSWQEWLMGGVVAIILTAGYSGARYARLGQFSLNLRTLRAMGGYALLFLHELVKSNLDVASRVLQPSLPIHPGIVEVKTSLRSPIGRLVLANSITLTPGTLTVETHDEFLFIHWIDVRSPDIEAATAEIVQKFERYLEVIYG